MNILVCIRRVPDPAENEIRLNRSGTDIERDDLVYSINEWDNYAVEEALQITARVGGEVTVVTVGGDEDEEVLRRQLAMGAKHAALLSDDAFAATDAMGIASILKAYAQQNSFDLVLTGVQAEGGGAQVGGMLAALLDWPFASLVTAVEVVADKKLKVAREIAGGNKEVSEIDLPCVLSIQTGINEPRYVGMRGVRQVASIEIPTLDAAHLRIDSNCLTAKVKHAGYFSPVAGVGAEMLSGDREHILDELVERLKGRGGITA
ncbi:electron transfer flavoprotein, beta-subunit [Candidatus Koribacter versatilis Ellin345]|uniref:Electron transfer flavoprotein subunit beta n=1 Tax=Koribacter versatilis (strain Ellin345) TaxID=204669 RepID=Q1IUI3_KORVE|nr:electron transfer flavoprotein subunit beta/FixA family protein [Candidatus Koribacter versatilis]ABF39467.1 electron transfer flavoprotein, beta-subunit [Candidatus Koribacter versatilis Ellin345]